MKEKLRQEPAFPIDVKNYQEETMLREGLLKHGISKRFYAACAAMQGILSNSDVTVKNAKDYAEMAYDFADEILKHETK